MAWRGNPEGMRIPDFYAALEPFPAGRLVFGAVMAARIGWRNLKCLALQGLSGLPDPVGRWSRRAYVAVLQRWQADVLELEAIAARLS